MERIEKGTETAHIQMVKTVRFILGVLRGFATRQINEKKDTGI